MACSGRGSPSYSLGFYGNSLTHRNDRMHRGFRIWCIRRVGSINHGLTKPHQKALQASGSIPFSARLSSFNSIAQLLPIQLSAGRMAFFSSSHPALHRVHSSISLSPSGAAKEMDQRSRRCLRAQRFSALCTKLERAGPYRGLSCGRPGNIDAKIRCKM